MELLVRSRLGRPAQIGNCQEIQAHCNSFLRLIRLHLFQFLLQHHLLLFLSNDARDESPIGADWNRYNGLDVEYVQNVRSSDQCPLWRKYEAISTLAITAASIQTVAIAIEATAPAVDLIFSFLRASAASASSRHSLSTSAG